ncbi:hypothetical protein SH611_22765 [Geminicoccaceae bacterium 1502E]|nr:hypothetical protein [Geminicoccaceae bacterium 1502E]
MRDEMRRCGLSVAVVWRRSGGTFDRAGYLPDLTNYYGNNSGQGYDNPDTHCWAVSAVVLWEEQKAELLIGNCSPRMDLIATSRISWGGNLANAVAKAQRGTAGRTWPVRQRFLPNEVLGRAEGGGAGHRMDERRRPRASAVQDQEPARAERGARESCHLVPRRAR